MNINDEINKLKDYQNLTGGYTDVALENIKISPFLFIENLKHADFLINEDEIRVYLKPKNILVHWFNNTFFKKKINRNLTLLAQYIYYWIPKTKIMPTINFYWGPIPNEYK